MEKLDEIIRGFQDIGCNLHREPRTFSFGTEEECRELFVRAFKAVDATVRDFVFLPEYQQIVKWMTDTRGQGLLLSGGCGLGKSVIISGVIPLIFKYKFNLLIHPVSASEMNDREKEVLQRPFICLDDVGTEPIKNVYGEKTEVFCNILDNAENNMKPVFVSTNLTGKQVQERYGDRAVDRIARLCYMVKITNSSGSLRPTQK